MPEFARCICLSGDICSVHLRLAFHGSSLHSRLPVARSHLVGGLPLPRGGYRLPPLISHRVAEVDHEAVHLGCGCPGRLLLRPHSAAAARAGSCDRRLFGARRRAGPRESAAGRPRAAHLLPRRRLHPHRGAAAGRLVALWSRLDLAASPGPRNCSLAGTTVSAGVVGTSTLRGESASVLA